MAANFEDFLRKFEVRPPVAPPQVPQPVVEKPFWEVRLVSPWPLIKVILGGAVKVVAFAYFFVFWAAVLLIFSLLAAAIVEAYWERLS